MEIGALSTKWSFRVQDFRGRAILWNKMQDVASVRGLSEVAQRGTITAVGTVKELQGWSVFIMDPEVIPDEW